MLTGDNGILTQANNAKIEQSHGAVKEAISLAYNEWQIQVKTSSSTKLASTETVTIKGEEEKALAGTSTTFLQFLNSEGYIKEGTTDVLDVEELTGGKQALGNGTDNDIYKIEEKDGSYVVSYYDVNGTPEEIWSTAKGTETGSAELEPDTGKESLILVYNVNAGDTIELPYYSTWYDGEKENPATFNFTVDWGDGNKTEGITNANIAGNSTHQYTEAGEKRIKITGTFESLVPYNESYEGRQGYDKLVRVEQWGTVGLKSIDLSGTNLTQIAQPTESSFKDLSYASFYGSGITSIPDNMFLNCTKITNFSECFVNCGNLTTIGNYAFAGCSSVKSFNMSFYECTNLQTIGDYAFAGCNSVDSFERCFFGCTNLTTIGKNIFEGCENVESYQQTFLDCVNLTGNAPELWLTGTNSKENNYKGTPNGPGCFAGCRKLTNYNEIPDYWKALPM